MPTDRTKQLVYELDAWYRGHTLRQKDLAAELGLTAQALSEILSLRNRPNSETALRIIEFLSQTMKTELVDPPTFPAESTRNPNEPKTLHEAKEMIADLRAQLKSAPPASTTKLAVTAPKAATPAPSSPWEQEIARAHAAATADLSSRPLGEQTVAQLRSALNAEQDPAKRTEIYRHLSQRKLDSRLSNPRARLRGA
jgi:transcriptional regulator with XRE-family HTH domain